MRRLGPVMPRASAALVSLNEYVQALINGKQECIGSIPERGWLLGAISFGFFLRALRWHSSAVMFNDGPTFIGIAQQMASGDFAGALSHDQHPLYPFLISVAHLGIPDWEQAAAWVCIVSGTFSILCLYAFLRDAFGARIALVGGFLYAAGPAAVRYTADTQSEGLYFLFFFAGVAMLWKALERGKAALATVTGALAGCAYLTRPEGLGIVFIGCGLGLLEVVRRRWSLLRGLGWVSALVLAAGLVMAPYLASLRASEGAWTLTRKKSVAVLLSGTQATAPSNLAPVRSSTNLRGSQANSAVEFPNVSRNSTQRSPTASGRTDVSDVFRGEAEKVAPPAWYQVAKSLFDVGERVLSKLAIEIVLLLLASPFLLRRPMGRRGLFVSAFLSLYLLACVLLRFGWGYVSGRHVLPVVTLCNGYAALGVAVLGWILRWIGTWLFRKRFSISPLAIGVGVIIGLAVISQTGLHQGANLAERHVAEWFRGAERPAGGLMVSRLRVAYYAGVPFISLADVEKSGDPRAAMHAAGVRYLIIEDDRLSRSGFVEEMSRSGELHVLHCESAEGRRVCLYEWSMQEGRGVDESTRTPK